MANLLKAMVSTTTESLSRKAADIEPLKREVLENIEELTKEVHYLKEKVKLMLAAKTDREELIDTLFKLKDIKNSLDFKKQQWKKLLPNTYSAFERQAAKAVSMLQSSTKHLQGILQQTFKI